MTNDKSMPLTALEISATLYNFENQEEFTILCQRVHTFAMTVKVSSIAINRKIIPRTSLGSLAMVHLS